jgi:hypothetical protein
VERPVDFGTSFRRHLSQEQRRAVLDALREKLDLDATIGDILDAAQSLGWGDPIGDFSLAELAEALLVPTDAEQADEEGAAMASPQGEAANAAEGKYEDEDEDEDVEAVAASRTAVRKTTKKKPAKKAAKAASRTTAKKTAKKAAKTAAKATPKASAKSVPRPKPARLKFLRKRFDADDRMSLEEAAELLVPVVAEFDQATMQDLEEFTGIGRRKLRFHIGQLVRHDYLERHGMGRGTYYTVAGG